MNGGIFRTLFNLIEKHIQIKTLDDANSSASKWDGKPFTMRYSPWQFVSELSTAVFFIVISVLLWYFINSVIWLWVLVGFCGIGFFLLGLNSAMWKCRVFEDHLEIRWFGIVKKSVAFERVATYSVKREERNPNKDLSFHPGRTDSRDTLRELILLDGDGKQLTAMMSYARGFDRLISLLRYRGIPQKKAKK